MLYKQIKKLRRLLMRTQKFKLLIILVSMLLAACILLSACGSKEKGDYSNESELGKSGAVVEVFTSEDRNPTIFRVPEGIKEVWDVFTLKDGRLTAINREGEMICPEKIAAAAAP